MKLVRANLLLLFSAVCLWAQPQVFFPRVLATPGDPSQILYGAYNGALVQSTDLGHTWTPLYITAPGLPQPPVLSFAIDELDHDILYLATTQAGGTFWRSADRGITWKPAVAGLPSGGVSLDFFKQIRDGDTIRLYVKVGQLLYISTNRGDLWIQQGSLPSADGVMDFAPLVRARGYFLDRTSLQAYNTIDEGHSWNAVASLSPTPPSNVSAETLAIPYADSERAYISVGGLGSAAGVYQTINAGILFSDIGYTGLGQFEKLFSGSLGPLYAPGVRRQRLLSFR